jgi:hypothetical protein
VKEKRAGLNYREKIIWKQRAQVQWMSEGDINTRFFRHKASPYLQANSHGIICDKLDEPEHMAHEFYANLYKSDTTIGIEEVLSHVPRKITHEIIKSLNAEYT